MFFTKNETSVIKEEIIKKTLIDKDGKVLLHINIAYPVFILKDKDKLKSNAKPFYEKIAKNFLQFVESELLARAKKLLEREDFRPLGGVMRYTNSYENKHTLSIYTDISIYDGVNEQNQLRTAQVWNKEKGYIYSFSDIFNSGAKEYLLNLFAESGSSGILQQDEYKKCLKTFFAENNFFLTEKAFVFFYPAERLGGKQGVKVFFADIDALKEKKLFKISL
ncbi:MAG: hypothetical protein A2Y15_00725 [Clostridiales bacterium GWF2_36_10]|nr:MAG: hypothetical protein A2Y15_00725 [Clostridiales bacterium GWF2_36_10]HAN21508.1 hypothetical protein [Clostridiales bacterium]